MCNLSQGGKFTSHKLTMPLGWKFYKTIIIPMTRELMEGKWSWGGSIYRNKIPRAKRAGAAGLGILFR